LSTSLIAAAFRSREKQSIDHFTFNPRRTQMTTYRRALSMIVVLLCVFTVPAIGAEMEKGKTMDGPMHEGMMPMASMMTCAPTGMMGGMMTMMCTPMMDTDMGMEGTMMTDEMKSMMTTKHNKMMMDMGEMMMKQGQMMMEKGKKGMMRK
jgi:hypothetical protein